MRNPRETRWKEKVQGIAFLRMSKLDLVIAKKKNKIDEAKFWQAK